MIWIYILSTVLVGVLWYLLKHTYVKIPTSWCKYDWHPFRFKRWKLIVFIGVWFLPILNLIFYFFLLLFLIVDDDNKFVIDNWFTRKWARVKEWLSKEI